MPADPQRHPRGVRALVAAGRAALAALRRHRRRARLLPRVDRRAARPAVRDRRRRHQAGRHRAARDGRLDVEVPALGVRLQVPGAAGDDEAQGDPRERRPHRRGDAVRRPRAGLPRRLDNLQGDAPQRPGSGAQGHPRRRLRPDREGRRRDPEGRDVAAAAAADRRRRAAAVGDAVRVPDLRDGAGPRRRGSGLALREHELSGPPAPQPRALRLAAGDEHRRLRRVAGRLGRDARAWSPIRPTSTP